VKAFHFGEQRKIFDDALDKMRIYDDSKNFIVNDAVEKSVADIKTILKMPSPYAYIPKLPRLIDGFVEAYTDVLEGMTEPIFEAIADAKGRVMDELKDKSYHDELMARCRTLFEALQNKAEHCNVAKLHNIKIEADALKVRLLNEIFKCDEAFAVKAQEEANKQQQISTTNIKPANLNEVPKLKRRRNISIKTINAANSWQIESIADVDKYLSDLRLRILKEIDEETIVNIEF